MGGFIEPALPSKSDSLALGFVLREKSRSYCSHAALSACGMGRALRNRAIARS